LQTAANCLVSGSDCVKELSIAGKGTFTVLVDGSVVFTPLDSYRGGLVWATYRASDIWGQFGENIVSVNVIYAAGPVAEPINTTVNYDTSAELTPVVTGITVMNDQTCLVSGSDCVKVLFVDGKGTFTVLENGDITFDPLSSFRGGLAWATYRAYDAWGQFAEGVVSVNVLFAAAPVVEPSSTIVNYNTPTSLTVNVTGEELVPSESCLVTEEGCVKHLVIAGKGTFDVLEDGTVTFSPDEFFVGGLVWATYRA
jgi:hypothetical protein